MSPAAPLRYCAMPGCRAIVPAGRCAQHQPREGDRPNVDVRKLYRSPRWARLRRSVQQADPFCASCRSEGRLEVWTDLDHIQPHRGDLARFWDVTNLAGLCHRHHAQKTGRGQ